MLERSGVPYEVLDRDRPRRAGLGKVADKLVGALRLPNDQTGDCQLFTTRLAEMARAWAWSSASARTSSLDFAGDRINGVLVNGGLLTSTTTCWPWAATRRNCSSRWVSRLRSIR